MERREARRRSPARLPRKGLTITPRGAPLRRSALTGFAGKPWFSERGAAIRRGVNKAQPACHCPSGRRSVGFRPSSLRATQHPMIRPVATEIALFLAPFVVYAIFLWATRAERAAPGVVAACDARLAHHRVARADARQLRGARALLRRRRRTRNTSRRTSRTASSSRGTRSEARGRLARAKARSRGSSRCSTATARRRAWSAARCATRCSAAAGRHRCRHHGAARRGDPPRRGRRLQAGADRASRTAPSRSSPRASRSR